MTNSAFHIIVTELLLLIAGVAPNPGPRTRAHTHGVTLACTGSHHQGDLKVFSSNSVGKQCVANSVCAVIKSHTKDLTEWCTADMDNILCVGDGLYQMCNTEHDLLEFADLPSLVEAFGHQWNLENISESHAQTDEQSIRNSIQDAVNRGRNVIVLLGD